MTLSLAIDLHTRFIGVAERYEALGLHLCAVLPRQLAEQCKQDPHLYQNWCEQLEAHVATKERTQ